jgi:hypothetical protein
MTDRMHETWCALRACLEAHGLELLEEVRTYPTPIARCDEHLTQAIEQRDAAFRRLRAASDLDGIRGVVTRAEWRSRLRGFAASLEAGDDRILVARARLIEALGRP